MCRNSVEATKFAKLDEQFFDDPYTMLAKKATGGVNADISQFGLTHKDFDGIGFFSLRNAKKDVSVRYVFTSEWDIKLDPCEGKPDLRFPT